MKPYSRKVIAEYTAGISSADIAARYGIPIANVLRIITNHGYNLRVEDKQDYQRVFDFIVRYKSEHDGLAPSLRDICDSCDCGSTSVASYMLDRLEESGKISRIGASVSRSILVVGGHWSYQP